MSDLLKRALTFAHWALTEGAWQGCDLDGSQIQDRALALGLIKAVPYDPAIHGESDYDIEPGDDWYVLADDAAAALSP